MSVTTNEVLCAYLDCRKHKRNTQSATDFESNLNRNIQSLKTDLNTGVYEIGASRCFVVTKPRPREVWAGDFRDRVVHHVMYNAIGPSFISTFSADSSACIPGRGTLYGAQRLESKIRSVTQNWSEPCYFLKLDLSNFFVSICKPILFELLEPKIADRWMLELTEQILFHDPTRNFILSGNAGALNLVPAHKSLFNAPEGYGLPIGNLSSQFFANVYLNLLDQFIKHQIRPLGYARYVDDFVLLHPDPAFLNEAQRRIEEFLHERLRMAINPTKTILQPVAHGVDFVGHVIKPWHTVPRKTLAAGASLALREGLDNTPERLTSYLGLLGQNDSYNTRAGICREALKAGYPVSQKMHRVYPKPQVFKG